LLSATDLKSGMAHPFTRSKASHISPGRKRIECRGQAFVNFFRRVLSIAGKPCKQLFRAEPTLLIYTAFTNLICNKEKTYGRDQ
jgi:hypothetical protein